MRLFTAPAASIRHRQWQRSWLGGAITKAPASDQSTMVPPAVALNSHAAPHILVSKMVAPFADRQVKALNANPEAAGCAALFGLWLYTVNYFGSGAGVVQSDVFTAH